MRYARRVETCKTSFSAATSRTARHINHMQPFCIGSNAYCFASLDRSCRLTPAIPQTTFLACRLCVGPRAALRSRAAGEIRPLSTHLGRRTVLGTCDGAVTCCDESQSAVCMRRYPSFFTHSIVFLRHGRRCDLTAISGHRNPSLTQKQLEEGHCRLPLQAQLLTAAKVSRMVIMQEL